VTRNPYKYTGPLDPVNDRHIWISRTESTNQVIDGMRKGNYWAVLVPRYIGKTTFLNQLRNRFATARYLYFSFKKPPANEKKLYQMLIHRFMAEIPSNQTVTIDRAWKGEKPDLRFFEFLKKFKPTGGEQKIVLLFDDIDHLPSLGDFLIVWRNLYHESYYDKILSRYTVLLTGSVNLIAKTRSPNSPFNIARIVEIKDFSDEESATLIEIPMKQININIEPEAKAYLLSLVSGHPQLLQHACHILVDMVNPVDKTIKKKDIDEAKQVLLKKNPCLNMLKDDINKDETLKKFLQDILEGKKIKFLSHKELALWGVGSIAERDSYCAIRNKLYEEVIKKEIET
jgi:hypothetical protein